MESNWREVSLKDMASEITVGHVGPMALEYVREGVPYLRSQNVDYLKVNTQDIKYITPEFHQRLGKSALAPGDVVIVRTGKPGVCAVIPDWLPIANCADLVIVRCGIGLDPRFLAYYVNSVASHYVAAYLVGAVQQHFNVGSARTMRLLLPNIEEQRAIAHILGTLDDKIELNRRMNETLEAMAQALFKSWFVDFDPVRAKMEGRPTGLPKEIEDQFPDSFEDSELGEIPKGWEIAGLNKIAKFTNGLALQKYPYQVGEEYLPVIKIAQLNKGSTEGADKANTKLPEEFIVENGDILFSWSGSLAVVIWGGGKGALNQHIFKVHSENYPKWFYYFWIRFHLNAFREIAANKATTMGHIQRKHLDEAKVLIPKNNLLKSLNVLILPILDKVISTNWEIDNLTSIRNSLLPKLLSGEIRVNDPEIFLKGIETS